MWTKYTLAIVVSANVVSCVSGVKCIIAFACLRMISRFLEKIVSRIDYSGELEAPITDATKYMYIKREWEIYGKWKPFSWILLVMCRRVDWHQHAICFRISISYQIRVSATFTNEMCSRAKSLIAWSVQISPY